MSDGPDFEPGSRLDTPQPTPRRTQSRPQPADTGWTQEDEDRYQQRRLRIEQRGKVRKRQAISFTVIVLLVIGIGVLGAAIHQGVVPWPFGSGESTAQACPTTPTDTPAQPADVSVKVLNATSTSGLARRVATELKARGYVVVETGNAADDKRNFADPAQIQYGKDGLAAAKSLQVQIAGAVLVDDKRADSTVDLLIGTAYTALVPADQAAAKLKVTPVASPSGCTPA